MEHSERESDYGVAGLPRAAAIAVVGRCALRILPVFRPALPDVRRDVAAATACGLLAVQASTRGVEPYRELALAAARVLRTPRDTSAAEALRCFVSAAEALSAQEATLVNSALLGGLAAYRAIAKANGLDAPFERSLRDDLKTFDVSDAAVRYDRSVPFDYFRRPLWGPTPGLPKEFERHFSEWQRQLDSAELSKIADLYLQMCAGAAVLEDAGLGVLAGWASEEGLKLPATPTSPIAAATDTDTDADIEQPLAEPPAPAPRPPDVWMLSDKPLEDHFGLQDRFQFIDYADALAAILDHEKTGTPFTMAINAPWGAGKTTLANMIAAQLTQRPKDRGQPPHIICRFNAWMHDDAPNLATAFISEVSRTANRHRHPLWRVLQPLPPAVLEPNRRRWRRLTIFVVALLLTGLVTALTGEHLLHLERQRLYEADRRTSYQRTETVTRDASSGRETQRTEAETLSRTRDAEPPPEAPLRDAFDPWIGGFQSRMMALGAFFTAVAGVIGVLTAVLTRILTSTSLGRYVEDPGKAAEAGAIQSAERQLKRLIKQATWRGNRFVVFVDDIERCKPPRSVDVLDAINQLMDHKNVLVVLLGDMSAVAAAAQLKYKDLAAIYVPSAGIAGTGADHGAEAFGRLYLQKIIQFQFDLPIPPKDKIRDYMGRLAVTPGVDGGRRGAVTT